MAVGASGAIESLTPAWAQSAGRRASTPRVSFVRAPLQNGIIAHAGATSMELYHQHPHLEREEIVQPEDIRLQTRLVMRNHKEILDWMGLGWKNVVKVTRYQKRMDESRQIEEVLASYFKDWWPAMTVHEITGLSSPQARLEIDMWVVPNGTTPQATAAIIRGIDPILPRPEVTGRLAFAPGIKIGSEMDLVHLSGITAYPPDIDPWNPGAFKLPADPAARRKMATDNLDRVLKAAGSTWQHIVFNVNYIAQGDGGIDFRAQTGDWSPCSTSLRVTDTGVPGADALYQITAAAPRKTQSKKGIVPGIEPVLHRQDVTLQQLTSAPAMRVGSDVDLLYFSGMTGYPIDVDPWNPGAFKLPDDPATQEKMLTDNVDRALKAAGITWRHIILMVRTGEVAGRENGSLREKLGDWRPCRTTRTVSTGVPGAKIMCEITAVAPRSGGRRT
jgi:enamine deaminase RidA (YjgF/YER057c/UK114 family)